LLSAVRRGGQKKGKSPPNGENRGPNVGENGDPTLVGENGDPTFVDCVGVLMLTLPIPPLGLPVQLPTPPCPRHGLPNDWADAALGMSRIASTGAHTRSASHVPVRRRVFRVRNTEVASSIFGIEAFSGSWVRGFEDASKPAELPNDGIYTV
jgi:hypothetical protein